MHHFAGLPLGAQARVYLGITHQSFSRPDLRGQWRGKRRGEVGSLQSPLCGPWQHLLMRDATHTLTCSLLCWSPFFPFLLPSTLHSPLFLPSVNSSCAPGNVFVSSLAPAPLLLSLSPLVSSVSGSLTSTLPHLPLSCCLLLTQCPLLFRTQHTLQKTTIKQTFLLVSLRSGTAQWLCGIYTKYKLCSSLQHP